MSRLQLCLLASRAPPTRRPSFDHALSKFFSARCNQTTHTHLVHHTRAFLHRRALTSSTFASTLWQDRGPTWCLLEDWRVHPWKCQQTLKRPLPGSTPSHQNAKGCARRSRMVGWLRGAGFKVNLGDYPHANEASVQQKQRLPPIHDRH